MISTRANHAWKLLQEAAERSIPAGVSRRVADRWLEQCARMRYLMLVPRAMPRCTPVIAVAGDEKLGSIGYVAVGVSADGLVECRELPPNEIGLGPQSAPRFWRQRAIEPARLFAALMRDDPGGPAQGLHVQLADYVVAIVRAIEAERFPWTDRAAVAEAADDYLRVLTEDIGRVLERARKRLAQLLPAWEDGRSSFSAIAALPLPPSTDLFNFFLDPQLGERRRQALQTYPGAAPVLMTGVVAEAIDRGRPIAATLAAVLGLSRTQLNAIRSPQLGAAVASLVRGGRAYDEILAALQVAPGALMPQRLDVLTCAVESPDAWALLCSSLRRYTGAAVLVDGAPYIPGFHNDGSWARDRPTRIGLATLNDSVRWAREALRAVVPPRLARNDSVVREEVEAIVATCVGTRRPEELVELDRALHRFSGALRKRPKLGAQQALRLVEDGTLAGYRFSQLRTMQEFAEEGASMHHCVATYYGHAVRGYYAVFRVQGGVERATLGVNLDMTVTGDGQKQGLLVSAKLDQVRGPRNAPVTRALEDTATAWTRKLDGVTLGKSAADALREARTAPANRKQADDEWKQPMYEQIRDYLWPWLPHADRAAADGWRPLLAARIEGRSKGRR